MIASLASLPPEARTRAVRSLSAAETLHVLHHWRLWARPEQLAPCSDWDTWLILAGRGWGKTRTGGEWVCEQEAAGESRVALVGATAADVRDVMIEGESGILACAPPHRRPKYEPSKRRLTWPSGTVATAFSAEEPKRLRGPQHAVAWCDEIAAWQYPDDTWDNLQFGMRLGARPRVCVTTTPRPIPIVRTLLKDPRAAITRGATFANRANLPGGFLRKMVEKYAGTRLGRQELYAEVLDDNPGALWKRALIDDHRVVAVPDFLRVVVAVDPAVSKKATSNQTGIVVIGIALVGGVLHGYVLADYSLYGTPNEWGVAVVKAYRLHKADCAVGEVNNGGDLVEANILAIDPAVKFKAVHASRGKQTRAEPVAALYEQGRIHHQGYYGPLEDQMCDWDPTLGLESPDRLDALVWGVTETMLGEAKTPPKRRLQNLPIG